MNLRQCRYQPRSFATGSFNQSAPELFRPSPTPVLSKDLENELGPASSSVPIIWGSDWPKTVMIFWNTPRESLAKWTCYIQSTFKKVLRWPPTTMIFIPFPWPPLPKALSEDYQEFQFWRPRPKRIKYVASPARIFRHHLFKRGQQAHLEQAIEHQDLEFTSLGEFPTRFSCVRTTPWPPRQKLPSQVEGYNQGPLSPGKIRPQLWWRPLGSPA